MLGVLRLATCVVVSSLALLVPAVPTAAAPPTGTAATPVADVDGLVPQVQQWHPGTGTFHLTSGARVVRDADVPLVTARAFAEDLSAITGQHLPLTSAGASHAGDVVLRLDPGLPPAPVTAGQAQDERYRIEVTDRVTIVGVGPAAVARGMQTLEQLFSLSPSRADLAAGTIDDWPRAGDRGVMLDAGRHFYQVAYIKQLIREMAWWKLNTLHLHLTEWNGFRLDSPKFPGLAADQAYTEDDIAEIEAEAARYGIEVLPEIDLPAHASAITSYWPETNWSCPSMGTMFGTGNFTMDVTKPETLERTRELLDEFIPWFSGPRFHIGTDEYPTDAAQKSCPELVDHAREKGYGDTADVFVHYIDAVNEIVRAHGKTTVVWDWWRHDQHPTVDVDKNIVVEAWTNDGVEFVEDGYDVLVAWSSRFYVTPGAPPGGSLQPDTTWLTDGFEPRQDSAVQGYLISRWSDQAEQQTDSYFDWFAHRPQQVLADRAWGAGSSATAFDIEDRVDRLGPPPGVPWRTQPDAVPLQGRAYASGPPWDAAGDPSHAFDGDPDTYVDLNEDAGYVGLDLGAGQERPVTAIRFAPRGGSGLGRMVGGRFQGCTDGPDTGCVDLATIRQRPPRDWMHLPVTDDRSYRWYRYLSPAGGHTNVAEIEFLTAPRDGLTARLAVDDLTALDHNEFTLTVRNGTDQVLAPTDITVQAVGIDSSAHRTVGLEAPTSSIGPGETRQVRGRISVPIDSPGEILQVQAVVTAEDPDGGLVLARASAYTHVAAPFDVSTGSGATVMEDGHATAAVVVTNHAAGPLEATLRPEPPAGTTVTPGRTVVVVRPGQSVSTELEIRGPDTPGVLTVPVRVQVAAHGERLDVVPAPELRVSTPYPDLASAFNTHGMTDDSDPAPPDLGGGIDGDGSSYSWQALADQGVQPGGPVSHGGYAFTWPERGTKDSIISDSQLVSVGDRATGVGFLTSGEWGPVTGTGEVVYADGTSQTFTINDPDWQTPTLPAGTDVAIRMPYHNLAGVGRINRNTYIYFHEVATDPDKEIARIQLPDSQQGGRFHVAVFAMALK